VRSPKPNSVVLAHDAVGTAQSSQQVVDMHHLVDRIRRPGLLAVAKRSIGDYDISVFDRSEIKLDRLAVNVLGNLALKTD